MNREILETRIGKNVDAAIEVVDLYVSMIHGLINRDVLTSEETIEAMELASKMTKMQYQNVQLLKDLSDD